MARARSIPNSLVPSILKHWLSGESITEIVAWIERTNRSRKEPVHTSRSSVERIIERACRGDRKLPSTNGLFRVRLRSAAELDCLGELQEAYQDIADQPPSSPQEARDMRLRLRALAQLEELTFRRLRLSGIEGPEARALANKNEWARISPRLEADFPEETGAIETSHEGSLTDSGMAAPCP